MDSILRTVKPQIPVARAKKGGPLFRLAAFKGQTSNKKAKTPRLLEHWVSGDLDPNTDCFTFGFRRPPFWVPSLKTRKKRPQVLGLAGTALVAPVAPPCPSRTWRPASGPPEVRTAQICGHRPELSWKPTVGFSDGEIGNTPTISKLVSTVEFPVAVSQTIR